MLSLHLYEDYQNDRARYNREAQYYNNPLVLAQAVRGITASPLLTCPNLMMTTYLLTSHIHIIECK